MSMSDYIKREDALRAFNGSCSTVDADDILRHLHKSIDVIKNIPSADVVEVGKWCDMHEYILEMQADENGHNEFFRIIKLPVIFSNDELKIKKIKKALIAKAILYGTDD